ncbi:hypothetical protein CCMA1212_010855 [Trichoderma ghanense]|uniref:Uncharacterized protein n=1 Tax=Trichoderma ghanense TaxID=65468 RepID=A0ABY2GQ31_9HYPO
MTKRKYLSWNNRDASKQASKANRAKQHNPPPPPSSSHGSSWAHLAGLPSCAALLATVPRPPSFMPSSLLPTIAPRWLLGMLGMHVSKRSLPGPASSSASDSVPLLMLTDAAKKKKKRDKMAEATASGAPPEMHWATQK